MSTTHNTTARLVIYFAAGEDNGVRDAAAFISSLPTGCHLDLHSITPASDEQERCVLDISITKWETHYTTVAEVEAARGAIARECDWTLAYEAIYTRFLAACIHPAPGTFATLYINKNGWTHAIDGWVRVPDAVKCSDAVHS